MSELTGTIQESEAQGQRIRTFKGKFTYPSNDPDFRDGKFLGQSFPINVEFAIHPSDSGKVIINVPGANGELLQKSMTNIINCSVPKLLT